MSAAGGSPKGAERRQFTRRPVLDSFSICVVIPKKGGIHRLPLYDISDQGMGFDFDISGENLEVAVKKGETLEVHLYLNQSLYLPLTVEVARVEEINSVRRIGAQFTDKKSRNYKAFFSFLEMVDGLTDIAKLATS